MTIEEIKAIESCEEIETRAATIAAELTTADADAIKNLNEELTALETRKAELKAEKLAEAEDAKAVIEGKGAEIRKMIPNGKEGKTMDTIEFRNSQAYIDCFANAVKNDDYKELRKMLTSNADSNNVGENDGIVPVPDFISDVISTNWKKLEILNLCSESYLKGNVKFQFELSATDAVVHEEGAAAIDPEQLKLGIVTVTPHTVKKYIVITDEVMDLDSKSFLTYIYKELTYRIFKLAEKRVVNKVLSAPTTADATHANVVLMEATPAIDNFVQAVSKLSEEATNPVIVINRGSYAYYKTAGLQTYRFDPFDGMKVLYSDELYSVNGIEAEKPYAIVGDWDAMALNFPKGKNITFKYDELTDAPEDLVKIIGRMPMGAEVRACDRFVILQTPEAETEGEGE